MLGPSAMLGAAAGTAAAAESPSGPSGPPTNASTYNHGDESTPLTGIQWTNGDATATTGYGFSSSQSTDPTSNFGSVSPGVTSVETGNNTSDRYWFVRHQKNGQNSVWVFAGTWIQ